MKTPRTPRAADFTLPGWPVAPPRRSSRRVLPRGWRYSLPGEQPSGVSSSWRGYHRALVHMDRGAHMRGRDADGRSNPRAPEARRNLRLIPHLASRFCSAAHELLAHICRGPRTDRRTPILMLTDLHPLQQVSANPSPRAPRRLLGPLHVRTSSVSHPSTSPRQHSIGAQGSYISPSTPPTSSPPYLPSTHAVIDIQRYPLRNSEHQSPWIRQPWGPETRAVALGA